ncbi:MAG: carbohydrate-binding protein, partial [Armatimonadetes bacterium]|nr:carbohydrate-binding protein [Armatimonadota bacterium]
MSANPRPGGLVLFLALAVTATAAAATYHVSPSGRDSNTGRGPGPGQALRTLQAAVNKLHAGDRLLVHAGVYRETVRFARSGREGLPIVVCAAGDGPVVISGCEPISGWRKRQGQIWAAPQPWTLGPGRNQVFARGQALIEARLPNEPAPGLEMPVAGLSPLWPTFGEFSIPEPTKHPGRVVSKLLEGQPDDYWKGAIYYGVHYQGWSAQTGIIESSRSGEIQVGQRTRVWWFPGPYPGYKPEEGRGMIVGSIHALDQPGEWCWEKGVLYLIPPDDGPPESIEAKRRQLGLDLSGCRHINVRDLQLFACSARLEDSAHCTFENCRFYYISHFTRFDAAGQVAKGRDTRKSGETGIYVSGHDNAFINCLLRYSAGAGLYIDGYHQTVHNCWIDQVDYCSHYLYPIVVGWQEDFLNAGHRFTYNTMSNVGRSMVNFAGYGVNSRDRSGGYNQATLIAHNHMYNGMLQTRDAGFITGYYCDAGTCNGQNSQVIFNVLHDSFDIFAMRIHKLGLIYLDAGTCHVSLHDNLLWAAPGSLQRGLWFNTMCVGIKSKNNVFHANFERDCAHLRAEDFPQGRPFRFGHDFAHPPPLPLWPQVESRRLEAEDCVACSAGVLRGVRSITGLKDGQWFAFDVPWQRPWQSVVMSFASDNKAMNTDTSSRARPRHHKATDPLILEATVWDEAHPRIGKQWSFCYGCVPGSWLKFSRVPLGKGYERFRAVYGNNREGRRWLEVRLDSLEGPLVARVDLPRTEDSDRKRGLQVYGEAVGEVSPKAIGTHDVFVIFRSADDQPVGEFEYFRFERYRGELPLQKKEVKIEVRLDGPKGKKLGELYLRATGGKNKYRETVAALEPTAPAVRRRLCFLVRANCPGDLGRIDWLSVERAPERLDLTGLGLPPRRHAGRPVWPPVT